MRTLWKGLLVGAVVGGAVKAAREVQGEGTVDDVAIAVGKTAGQAAIAGAAVGLLMDRRAKRKRSTLQQARASAKSKVSLGMMVAGASALADAARPALHDAAERARPKLEAAAHTARPHVEHAADVARARTAQAANAAKPKLEAAGDKARAKLAELDLPVVVAV
jgi:hypothetical protein